MGELYNNNNNNNNKLLLLFIRYCNHRVVAYTLKGEFLYQLDSVIDGKELSVPHSLSLTSDGSQLFVADRENGRIVMYDLTTKIGRVFTSNDQLNGFIYAIAFGNHDTDWPLYAINGSADQSDSCYGFTINEEGVVVGTWGPSMVRVKIVQRIINYYY